MKKIIAGTVLAFAGLALGTPAVASADICLNSAHCRDGSVEAPWQSADPGSDDGVEYSSGGSDPVELAERIEWVPGKILQRVPGALETLSDGLQAQSDGFWQGVAASGGLCNAIKNSFNQTTASEEKN